MSLSSENWRSNVTMGAAIAALVLALAAFVASVSGIATASSKVVIRKGDIAPGAVTAKALSKGAVTGSKIRKAAITPAKLKKGAVTASKLANGSVTAPKLGEGSVTPGKLDDGAVTAPKLAGGSVTAPSIAPAAVTAAAIAPLSIGAAQLGKEEVVTKPIADVDQIPHNGEWTASNLEVAVCGSGSRLLSAGFSFSTLTNGEASWVEALPIINGEVNGVAGRFTSDAGGAAAGVVTAVCLK